MAEVDAATQRSLDREIALKRPRSDRNTDEVAASLIGEARMLASLDHPNIPPVHQLGFTADGQPVIVMKRVRGNSWRTLIQDSAHSFWDEQPRFQLKIHLGLVVPGEGCSTFAIDGDERGWEEGKAILFDDSFEHEVHNRCEGRRAVFQVVFLHPQLWEAAGGDWRAAAGFEVSRG